MEYEAGLLITPIAKSAAAITHVRKLGRVPPRAFSINSGVNIKAAIAAGVVPD